MARRREVNVFGLAFLDAMTCGLGAVVLLYMVINAGVSLEADRVTYDLTGEVDRLEDEVLGGHAHLAELRNAVRDADQRHALARGLSRRLIETLQKVQVELATFDAETLARREHLNKLKTDLKSLEEEARRLAASVPEEETPGEKIRAFTGDGDRQYLTGLKVGGERILLLVDTSASMLDETIVNIVVRRNLPDARKIRAEKWQQAVATVDWLTTQMPRESFFQVYTFAETAAPLVDGTGGEWLPAGDRDVLEKAVTTLRTVVPDGGTSLQNAFAAIRQLRPAPDNLILLTDGLPTQGRDRPRGSKVSANDRLKHFERAVNDLPSGMPVNVILFPMEGDPMAASAFWKLAMATRGSFLSPPEDWP